MMHNMHENKYHISSSGHVRHIYVYIYIAHPEDFGVLGRGLGWRVHGSKVCELLREVAHVHVIRDVGLEGRGHSLGQHILPVQLLHTETEVKVFN